MSEKKKKKTEQRPIKTIRRGAIAASVWHRQAASGFEYMDFSISRSWKSQSNGKEGYATSFFARNESELIAVIEETAAWIEQHHHEYISEYGEEATPNENHAIQ